MACSSLFFRQTSGMTMTRLLITLLWVRLPSSTGIVPVSSLSGRSRFVTRRPGVNTPLHCDTGVVSQFVLSAQFGPSVAL